MASPGLLSALQQGMPIETYYNNIRDFAASARSPEELIAVAQQLGISGEDIMRATGESPLSTYSPDSEPSNFALAQALESIPMTIDTGVQYNPQTRDVDQGLAAQSDFNVVNPRTGQLENVTPASEFIPGAPANQFVVSSGQGVFEQDGKSYQPVNLVTVDQSGNVSPSGTFNIEKNELSQFGEIVGGATKAAAIIGSIYAIGSSLLNSAGLGSSAAGVEAAAGADASFVAADAVGQAAQGLSQSQIAQNLVAAGVAPEAAAAAASAAASGASAGTIAGSLTAGNLFTATAADLAAAGITTGGAGTAFAGTGAAAGGSTAAGTSVIPEVVITGTKATTPSLLSTVVPAVAGGVAANTIFNTANSSLAPGSFQSTVRELGVTNPGGASVAPGSFLDTITQLGVTPLVQGGVNAGIANAVTNGLTNSLTNLPGVTPPGGSNLLSSLAGTADNLLNSASPYLSALASNEATKNVIDTLRAQGLSTQQAYRALGEETSRDVSFTPYGVSTGLFSTTRPTTTGQFDSSLSADGKSLFDAATAAAQGSFTEAGAADLNQMAADRMALYQQLVSPEQQRSRLAQEARLQAQGRLGVGAGGGEYAPELKALEDAIAKQNLQFALAAPQEALAQRTALINQGVSAAQVPTTISQQQLAGLQLGGQLGQQQAQTAYQRGGLLGQYAGQGISENLLAQLAAAQVQTEQNKALATAISGLGNRAGGSTGGGGLFSNLVRTGTDLYNLGSSIIG